MSTSAPIVVIHRETGEPFEEIVLGEKWLRWAYQNASSGLLEKLLFRSSRISTLMGRWYDSPFSRKKIPGVIRELRIGMTDFVEPPGGYRSFNDFFIRKLAPGARPFSQDPHIIVSPADSRVLVFPRLDGSTFAPVKGHPFSLKEMLPSHAERFAGGSLAILRLCPADYHRYHFPCNGEILEYREIPGALHSVNPVALESGADVFGSNKRSCTLLRTENAGTLCFMEVGAFGVGSIVNTRTSGHVEKMEEKGYFKFGGSTVILLFEPGAVTFEEDLVRHSAAGRETLIKTGEPLAKTIRI